jgi:hypothetical protein
MGDMGRMGGMGFMGGKSFVGVGRPAVAEAMAGKLRLGGRRGQTRARALPVGGWEQIAADQPFLEAALTPLAEVLLADGEALKFLCDDFPDFFEGVEPGEDLGGGLGAVEAVVQQVADGAWEMGDFAVAGVHSLGGFRFQFFIMAIFRQCLRYNSIIEIVWNDHYFKLIL